MSETVSFRDYVADAKVVKEYRAYQKQYSEKLRESDRCLIALLADLVKERQALGRRVSLLDIGCSTGNLLGHIRRAWPDLDLMGGDYQAGVVQECLENPDLQGMRFDQINIVEFETKSKFDFITVNALLGILSDEELEQAARNIARALAPGGALLAFDWLHPFDQDLTILEKSAHRREGYVLYFRPYESMRKILERSGFGQVGFHPFSIPIDLPKSEKPGDLQSYTVRADNGERMSFRGALFQPWCHLVARKPASAG